MSDVAVRPEMKFPREGDYVSCYCWCMRHMVQVKIETIWAKKTDSCGHPDCKEPDQ